MFHRSFSIAVSLFFTILTSCSVIASERLLEADINARAEYNDNIFLTNQEHDAVSGLIVTPSISGIIKEAHWDAALIASLRLQKYSDDSLDGNDQLLDLTGRYIAERNIFSLNLNHYLDSNLSSTSTDFGIVGRRIDSKMQRITPQYTHLLTESSFLLLSYTYTDVDYLDAEDTGFTPYVTETISGSIIYDIKERDKLTFSLTAVDYRSRNDLVTFMSFISRVGVEHKFTDRLSSDFLVGISRRNSTNLQTQSFDFFGQPITVTQEIDAKNRGLVFDAGIKYLFETGRISGRISRDDTTNSFGGLDETNVLSVDYTYKFSDLWRYDIRSNFSDIKSISSGARRTDREIFNFESIVHFTLARNWHLNASYRYIARKFKSDISEDNAPHSNRIYLGLTYNFPSLSTF